jgi:23S rRNA (uracil1939-C5)-methyltransferase
VNYRHKAIYTTTPRAADAPPVGHFSQNNRLANIHMLQRICDLVSTEKVTDLYAGAGNISIPLATAGHTVTAVEVDPHLVKFGIERSKAAEVSERLTFHTASCEKWVEKNTPDATIVLDPPRGGAFEVCKRLRAETSPQIVYVSCYPPTFARDVQELEKQGYRLRSVELLDMFPQTYHCELVAVIERAV